jgi:hypothetical protein
LITLSFAVFWLLSRSLICYKILALFVKSSESFDTHASHICFRNLPSLNGLPCLAILLLTSKLVCTTFEELAMNFMRELVVYSACDISSFCSNLLLSEMFLCAVYMPLNWLKSIIFTFRTENALPFLSVAKFLHPSPLKFSATPATCFWPLYYRSHFQNTEMNTQQPMKQTFFCKTWKITNGWPQLMIGPKQWIQENLWQQDTTWEAASLPSISLWCICMIVVKQVMTSVYLWNFPHHT